MQFKGLSSVTKEGLNFSKWVLRFFLLLGVVGLVFQLTTCSAAQEKNEELTPLEMAKQKTSEAEVAFNQTSYNVGKALGEHDAAQKALFQAKAAEAKAEAEAKAKAEALEKALLLLDSADPSTSSLPVLYIEVTSFTPSGVKMLSKCPLGWTLGFDPKTNEITLSVDGAEAFRFGEPKGGLKSTGYWSLCPGCPEASFVQAIPPSK
jgi:hypothetical protein